MATLLFANNASSTLAAPIGPSATTANLAVGTGSLFPNPSAGQYFVMTFTDAATGLLNEIVWVTARSGDSITITRAQEGTAAQSWAAGDQAQNLLTAGQMAALQSSSSGFANIAVYAIVGGTQQVSVNGAAYTSIGASIFTFPASGTAQYELKGGAAGGGSTGTTTGQAAGGGGEAGTVFGLLTGQTPGSTIAITVGVGALSVPGSGSSIGTNGGDGNDTTVGTAFTAGKGHGGGGAGTQPPGATGGQGGTATGGYLNIPGGYGMDGYFIGGSGGGSGGGQARETSSTALDGQAPGTGGAGSYNAASVRGGAGANGYVIVRY